MSSDNICKVLSTREAHLRLNAQGFLLEANRDHNLTDTKQYSTYVKGMKVFSINIVHSNSVGTVRHFSQLMVETLLKSKVPDASQG